MHHLAINKLLKKKHFNLGLWGNGSLSCSCAAFWQRISVYLSSRGGRTDKSTQALIGPLQSRVTVLIEQDQLLTKCLLRVLWVIQPFLMRTWRKPGSRVTEPSSYSDRDKMNCLLIQPIDAGNTLFEPEVSKRRLIRMALHNAYGGNRKLAKCCCRVCGLADACYSLFINCSECYLGYSLIFIHLSTYPLNRSK